MTLLDSLIPDCEVCGVPVPESRRNFAHPICYFCFPPPIPLHTAYLPSHVKTLAADMIGKRFRDSTDNQVDFDNFAFDSEGHLWVVYQSRTTGQFQIIPYTHPTEPAWDDRVLWPDGEVRTRFFSEAKLSLDFDFCAIPEIYCENCHGLNSVSNPVELRKRYSDQALCGQCVDRHAKQVITHIPIAPRTDLTSFEQWVDETLARDCCTQFADSPERRQVFEEVKQKLRELKRTMPTECPPPPDGTQWPEWTPAAPKTGIACPSPPPKARKPEKKKKKKGKKDKKRSKK